MSLNPRINTLPNERLNKGELHSDGREDSFTREDKETLCIAEIMAMQDSKKKQNMDKVAARRPVSQLMVRSSQGTKKIKPEVQGVLISPPQQRD